MRVLAIGGWLVIVAVLLAWQAMGLARGPEWPTISDMLRAFMSARLGRPIAFGLWLWIGWHLFVYGLDAVRAG
jgi:hypothetical protein